MKALLIVLGILASSISWAAGPEDQLPDALSARITERGLGKLGEIASSLIPADGEIPDIEYTVANAIELDSIPGAPGNAIRKIRDLIREWATGARLRDFKPTLQVSGIRYHLAGTRATVKLSDPGYGSDWYATGAIRVVVEAEFPSLSIEASKVRARDLNNRFLTLGANKLRLELAKGSEPLHARVEYLFIPGYREAELRLVGLTHNFDRIKLKTSFQRPLRLPHVEVTLGDQTNELDTSELEVKIAAQIRGAVPLLQQKLAKMVDEKARAKLEELAAPKLAEAKQLLHKSLPIPAAAAPEGSNPKPYALRVRPIIANATQDPALVILNAYIDDPTLAQQTWRPGIRGELPGEKMAIPFKSTQAHPPSQYDVAIGINEILFNRIMQLSFNRGYFKTLDLGGNQASLRWYPIVRFLEGDRLKLHLEVDIDISGWNRVFLSGTTKMSFDVFARWEKLGDDWRLILDGTDPDSVYISRKNVHFMEVESLIYDSVRGKLANAGAELRAHPKVLLAALPVPKAIAGHRVKVEDVRADDNAHLFIYLSFY